jgi:hypothetical protein
MTVGIRQSSAAVVLLVLIAVLAGAPVAQTQEQCDLVIDGTFANGLSAWQIPQRHHR